MADNFQWSNSTKKGFFLSTHSIGIISIFFLILIIPLTVWFLNTIQETRQHAQLNILGPHDNCNKLTITWKENISGATSCPEGQKNPNVASYGVTITVQSNTGSAHKFHYITYSGFCPQGSVKPCLNSSGAEVVSGDATTSKTITIPVRSPPTGSKCGTYQDDFVITTIDQSASCHYGDPNSTPNGSSAPGGAGFCATGVTCPIPATPTPSPAPSSFPTPTTTPTPTSPACQANQSTCQWNASTGAVSYHYKIIDVTAGSSNEGDVSAPQTSISFSSVTEHSYICTITPANVCGNGDPGTGTFTCKIPTPTACPVPNTPANVRISCPTCSGQ